MGKESCSRDDRANRPADAPAEHLLADLLARRWSSALTESLQAPVAALAVRVERTSCGLFTLGCRQPTLLVFAQDEPAGVAVGLEISLPVLFAMLNRLLGGSLDDEADPGRPLTETETRLARRCVDMFLRSLRTLLSLPSLAGDDGPLTGPRWQSFATSREPVACCEFRWTLGRATGPVRAAIPWDLFERLSADLAQSPDRIPSDRDPDALVELSVTVAQTTVPVADLEGLQVGDILATETNVTDPLLVALDGQVRFLARPGAVDGHKAIKIESPAPAE